MKFNFTEKKKVVKRPLSLPNLVSLSSVVLPSRLSRHNLRLQVGLLVTLLPSASGFKDVLFANNFAFFRAVVVASVLAVAGSARRRRNRRRPGCYHVREGGTEDWSRDAAGQFCTLSFIHDVAPPNERQPRAGQL